MHRLSNHDRLVLAVVAVQRGELSLRAAALHYNVPAAALNLVVQRLSTQPLHEGLELAELAELAKLTAARERASRRTSEELAGFERDLRENLRLRLKIAQYEVLLERQRQWRQLRQHQQHQQPPKEPQPREDTPTPDAAE